MTESLSPTEIAQAWQSFRERCVELAIKSGAGPDKTVDIAKQIATYVITKSDEEKKIAEATKG